MAVHRPLLRIEQALDLCVPRQLFLHRAHVAARGAEQGERRARPDEHANVHPLGQLGEKVPQDERRAVPAQREAGCEEPARDVHVGTSLLQRVRDRRQSLSAIDQNLDSVPRPRRGIPGGPAARGRSEGALPADSSQTALVVIADLPRDGCSEPAVDREQEVAGPRTAERCHLRPSTARWSCLLFICERPGTFSLRASL